MGNPRLRIRSSGLKGSGYCRPAIGDVPFQVIKNADSENIKALADENGKALRYPGVTTVLKQLDKSQLQQWKADSVAARAVANIDALLNRSELEGFEYLRWAADEIRDEAATQGTWGHEWIQADLGVGDFYPEPETRNHEEMVEAWDDFKFSHDIRNVRWAERTLGNFTHGFMATADLLMDIDDYEDCLLDIKTSRNTWPEHWMQLTAMKRAEVEFYEIGGDGTNMWYEGSFSTPQHAGLIHLRPSENDVAPFCNLLMLDPRKEDLYFRRFLAALESARAERELALLEKELDQ